MMSQIADPSVLAADAFFPVVDISERVNNRPETLGTKEKFWVHIADEIQPGERPYLFKMGRPNTGENWAEKVSSEIAHQLGIPSAKYELAECRGDRGVLTEQFFPRGGALLTANNLFVSVEKDYDGGKRFKQVEYRLSTALTIVRSLTNVTSPIGFPEVPDTPALHYFMGYLVFDALIGNTDRHHENWGVVANRESGQMRLHLAPSFDCASSLGRSETDERRLARLSTRDERATVEAYAARARSAFFGSESQDKCLTMRECLAELSRFSPDIARHWAGVVCAADERFFRRILTRISAEWISEPAIEFAVRLLMHNQRMIEEACHGR